MKGKRRVRPSPNEPSLISTTATTDHIITAIRLRDACVASVPARTGVRARGRTDPGPVDYLGVDKGRRAAPRDMRAIMQVCCGVRGEGG